MNFKDRACAGVPTGIFFEDAWMAERIPASKAIARARSYCDGCPVRSGCLSMEMEAEQGSGIDHRAGIYAGMTPAQRYSLERRGQGAFCSVCGTLRDPVALRHGDLSCETCGIQGEMLPLPDRGDQWTERHTKMAEAVIAWLVENVEPDGEAPTSAQLSRKLGLRVNDMRRVYDALVADQLLDFLPGSGKLLRRASASATKGWVPPHLRIAS